MKQHLPMAILILVSLAIGALTFADYGESWDVNSLSDYAGKTIRLYRDLFNGGEISPSSTEEDLALGNYGPAYMLLLAGVDRLFPSPYPDGPGSIQHFLSFLTFLVGVAALYLLALRWMSPWAAFGATLLLLTQPVFWGHAFINPKDVPFMTAFLLALVTGLRAADRLHQGVADRHRIFRLGFFWLLPTLVILAGSGLMLNWIEALVRSAAAGGVNIVSFSASHIATAPPELYIQKYSNLFIRAAFLYLLLSVPLVAFYISRRDPSLYSALAGVILAAIVLGITVSIRIVGLYAGILVTAFVLWKHRGRALVPLLLYAVIAASIVYLLWPYLWVDPASRLMKSAVTMARYPWAGSVRFEGVDYPAADLPTSYLPVILEIQLTEPVWVLFAAGLGLALISIRERWELVLLVILWFVLPLIGLLLAQAVLYDNFRQILFLLPPIFLTAGFALERIRPPLLRVLVVLVLAIPGVMGIWRLHPYEYVYYNSFAGGVRGAYRNYELDYWGTSYREAALWLNTNSPPNAKIWSEGPAHLLGKYLREDLKLYSSYEAERADQYQYVVALTRYDLDLWAYPDGDVVHRIERDGAVLAVIKRP